MSNPHPQNRLAHMLRHLDRERNDLENIAADLVDIEDQLWSTVRTEDLEPIARERRNLRLRARRRAA